MQRPATFIASHRTINNAVNMRTRAIYRDTPRRLQRPTVGPRIMIRSGQPIPVPVRAWDSISWTIDRLWARPSTSQHGAARPRVQCIFPAPRAGPKIPRLRNEGFGWCPGSSQWILRHLTNPGRATRVLADRSGDEKSRVSATDRGR